MANIGSRTNISGRRVFKTFVRIGSDGRVVPGSNILRRTTPKGGTWIEIPTYNCCSDTTTTLLPT